MKLTPEQEKDYLLDLLFEAARYRDVTMDSPYSAIELEIRDRIQRISNAEDDTGEPKTIIKPGQFVDTVEEPLNEDDYMALEAAYSGTRRLEPDDYKALEAARLNEYLERRKEQKKPVVETKSSWKQRNVRVRINGKTVWRPREQCRQVPRDNSNGGLPWMWKFVGENSATVDENSETKNKQCEAMWAEHEKEEK